MPLDEPGPIDMGPGDIFALISDGIFEQENGEEEQFGIHRTLDVITENRTVTMEDLVSRMIDAVQDFAEGTPQEDDMTIVLVKREEA